MITLQTAIYVGCMTFCRIQYLESNLEYMMSEGTVLGFYEIAEFTNITLCESLHTAQVYEQIVVLQVKPVSYLMINSETVLHSVAGLRLTAFPTAMTIKFSVSFHDEFGVEFYATSSRVRLRLHKYVVYLVDMLTAKLVYQ